MLFAWVAGDAIALRAPLTEAVTCFSARATAASEPVMVISPESLTQSSAPDESEIAWALAPSGPTT